jgi:hypothetical protein
VIGTPRAGEEVMRLLIATMLLTSCAAAPLPAAKPGPRGLHANGHLDVARTHEDLATQATGWPADAGPGGMTTHWARAWDTGAEHERIARVHRSNAAQLEAAYAEACGDRPLDIVSISPLQRYAIGGWNTPTGVELFLSSTAGDPDRLLADLKCHRAWMMLAPAAMEDCPLDLPGLVLDAHGDIDGISVALTVRDPKLVPELQRRAAHDLEMGATLQARHAH